MIHFYIGTDSKKIHAVLSKALEKAKGEVVRISDAHTLADLQAALGGGGMFGGARTVVLNSTIENEDMAAIVLSRLAELKQSNDTIYIVETSLDAATRKTIEKYAENSQKFDLVKGKSTETIFSLVRPLQEGKKKDLWVAYQRELVAGKAAEAIHGMMFFAAKDLLLKKPSDARAKRLVAELAELPHEARRSGYELEYALEEFTLARV
jgi:hypothetical protein